MKAVTKKSLLPILIAAGLVLGHAVVLHAAEEFTLETALAAAAKGDARAEYFLAKQYAKGEAVKQDFVKAA